jgi:hypothetical protein
MTYTDIVDALCAIEAKFPKVSGTENYAYPTIIEGSIVSGTINGQTVAIRYGARMRCTYKLNGARIGNQALIEALQAAEPVAETQPIRTRAQQLQGARNQFRALFREMATRGDSWHIYALDNDWTALPLMSENAKFDIEPVAVIVRNVQAMTEQQLVNALACQFDRKAWGTL